jgi:prepilin signal peptidase PulO-like enzyme (type II secretory pathway)
MKIILDHIKKEETFGLGDVFVIFCLGLFFEPFSFSLILFLSSILGLLIFGLRFILLNKEKKIPFATIMAIGALGISPLS